MIACGKCGAPSRQSGSTFCAYCGTRMPDAGKISGSEYQVHAERYTLASKHPDLSAAMKHRPPLGQLVLAAVAPVFMLGLLAAFITGYVKDSSQLKSELFGMMGLIAVVFLIVCGVLFVKAMLRLCAPLEHIIAVIVDKRTNIKEGRKGGAEVSYQITIQTEGIAPRTLTTDGDTSGLTVLGDIGVAYVKRDLLLGFQRLVV